MKTGKIHPQITQMDADSEAQKNNLRKSAKSADNSFSEARETDKTLKEILQQKLHAAIVTSCERLAARQMDRDGGNE